MPASNSSALSGARVYELALEGAGGNRAGATSAASGTQLCVGLYQPAPYDLSVTPMDVPRLSINLRSVAVRGCIGGGGEHEYAGRRHSLFFTPAGASARWRKRAPSRHLNIYFHPRVLDETAEAHSSALLDQPLMDVHRPAMRAFIDALEQTIVRDEPFARDASTNLALLILAELVNQPAQRAPVLSAGAVMKVRDYVATYLDQPIRVTDLAAAVGLSPGRFAVAFHAATGTPPHRYVLAQRVARAMELLRGSRLDLVEVALACGFSSQQHMTTTMHRAAGTTPARVRRGSNISIDDKARPRAAGHAPGPSSTPSP